MPRRVVTLTRSEEIARAAVWSGFAFCLSWIWAHLNGCLGPLHQPGSFEVFLSGLFNENYFHEQRTLWFQSARAVFWLNWALLWRIYVLVIAVSLLFNLVIMKYGKVRHRCRDHRFLAWLLADLVLPRIAPWHVVLSDLLLHEDAVSIHIDVLTKSNILYQGTLADKVLDQDGGLVNLTLDHPRRFRREQYQDAWKNRSNPNSDDFWKEIPTSVFVLMAGEIHSLNIRHVPQDAGGLKRLGDKELGKLLESLSQAVQSARKLEGRQGPLTS